MLPEADYGLTSQALGQNQDNMGRARDTSGLLVKFYMEPYLNKAKSKEQGRPIYEDVEFVSIKPVGTRTNGIVRKATSLDLEWYPEHYAKFKARVEGERNVEGSLLVDWPPIPRALVEEYKFLNIFTVEQLAAVSDTNLRHGMLAWREKAKLFLETAHINVNAERMAEIEQENAEMKRQLAELMASREQETPVAAPKKRKRRTKAEIAAALEVESAEEAQTE